MLHWELEDAIGAQLTSRAAAYSVDQGGPFAVAMSWATVLESCLYF